MVDYNEDYESFEDEEELNDYNEDEILPKFNRQNYFS